MIETLWLDLGQGEHDARNMAEPSQVFSSLPVSLNPWFSNKDLIGGMERGGGRCNRLIAACAHLNVLYRLWIILSDGYVGTYAFTYVLIPPSK